MAVSAARLPARLALVRAVPAWAWLTGLVAVSALLRFQLSRSMTGPWIFVDELVYSELAKSIASSGELLVRGEAATGYGAVYPLLIAPAWALFDAIPDAYAAAKAINAVLMSLAAVPAYLLARRVVGWGLALLAAVLALALPSLVYTGTIMTENAFYPVFLATVYALVLVLERPTPVRQLVLLVLLGIAFETRAQAVALVAAALTAPVVQGLLARRVRAAVSAQRLLYGVVAAGVLLLAVVQLARGAPLAGLLGAYSVAGGGGYDAGAVARHVLYHAAELDLYLGVIPFAAAALLLATARGLDERAQAFLAAAVASSGWLLLVVAAFASRFAGRVQERNLFYVAPLVLVALLAWIERGCPRPPRATAVAAVVAAALPGVLPYHRLIDVPAVSDTLALLPWWALQDSVITLDEVSAVVVVGAILAAAAVVSVPRRWALALPALVLLYYAVILRPIDAGAHGVRQASRGALFTGVGRADRDWIDRAVPEGAEVAALWTGKGHVYSIWENEFFNRRVGRVLNLTGELPGGLAETRLVRDPSTGVLVDDAGEPARVEYLLVDGSFTPAGEVVARDEARGMTVYRVDGELRSLTEVRGLHPNDTWSGRQVTWTRLDCAGGTLTVRLRSDPSLFETPQIVRAGRRVVSVPPAGEASLAVPLAPRAGRCSVTFTVDRTLVPALATKGENPDTRPLGVHFERFDYAGP